MIRKTSLSQGRKGVMLSLITAVIFWTSLSSMDAYVLSDGRLLRHLQTTVKLPLSRGILHESLDSIGSSTFARNSPDKLLSAEASMDSRLRARQYIQDGMLAFRQGNVSKSIELFDLAEQMDASIAPYLWQRGLSYYYANDFDRASQQFRLDVRVNPYDVEEIVWDVASQLQSSRNRQPGLDPAFPIPNQLSLPAGSNDRRRIMGFVYKLFRGEGTEQDLAAAGHASNASLSDEFYALFYLALFNEVRIVPSKAELYLRQALSTRYAQSSNDYMVACAKVQARVRGWT